MRRTRSRSASWALGIVVVSMTLGLGGARSLAAAPSPAPAPSASITSPAQIAAAHGPAPSTAPSGARKAKPAPKRPNVGSLRYAQTVRAWHTAAPGKKAREDGHGRPMLTLSVLNTGERLELSASSDQGAFASRDLDRVAHALREPSSASEHPIEPRLLDLLYRIQRKFAAQEIRVVSGYRPGRTTPLKAPVRGAGSNHACGRAADIVVPGARDEDVAKFARELGFIGVGIYPTSGFVHVDVRGQSYFWVDRSGPGRRNRERGVFADLAKKSDAKALARGERPTGPFSIGLEVESFLDAHDRGADMPETPDEDDDDV